jgi:hypothetical protein
MINNEKKIGVWLDHHHAHFIELNNGEIVTQTIESGYTRHPREEGEGASGSRFGMHPTNNENNRNNKMQNELKSYYKLISERLSKYNHILLFGPTTAKNELFNFMKQSKCFSGIRVDVRNSGKLTENQLKAFVREHFSQS